MNAVGRCDSIGMPSDGLDQEAEGAYAKTGGRRVGPKGGPLTAQASLLSKIC